LAPLGVASESGRMLDVNGQWSAQLPMPLLRISLSPAPLGTVRTLTTRGGALWVTGTLAGDLPPSLLDDMRRRRLRPGFTFGDDAQVRHNLDLMAKVAVHVTAGTIVAVYATTRAEYPDVWFDLDWPA
jgi:hypothetical protein